MGQQLYLLSTTGTSRQCKICLRPTAPKNATKPQQSVTRYKRDIWRPTRAEEEELTQFGWDPSGCIGRAQPAWTR